MAEEKVVGMEVTEILVSGNLVYNKAWIKGLAVIWQLQFDGALWTGVSHGAPQGQKKRNTDHKASRYRTQETARSGE